MGHTDKGTYRQGDINSERGKTAIQQGATRATGGQRKRETNGHRERQGTHEDTSRNIQGIMTKTDL